MMTINDYLIQLENEQQPLDPFFEKAIVGQTHAQEVVAQLMAVLEDETSYNAALYSTMYLFARAMVFSMEVDRYQGEHERGSLMERVVDACERQLCHQGYNEDTEEIIQEGLSLMRYARVPSTYAPLIYFY